MAVGTYTYGTVAGVEQRVGWVVDDRTFATGTTPTLTEVEGILDQVASEIHRALAESGYPVSTKTTVTTDAPRAATWLTSLNEDGAASRVMMMSPYEAMPDSENRPPYETKFKNGLKAIAGIFLEQLGLSRERALSAYLVSGSYKTTTGNVKKPLFKRDTFDYPSSRSLTE